MGLGFFILMSVLTPIAIIIFGVLYIVYKKKEENFAKIGYLSSAVTIALGLIGIISVIAWRSSINARIGTEDALGRIYNGEADSFMAWGLGMLSAGIIGIGLFVAFAVSIVIVVQNVKNR